MKSLAKRKKIQKFCGVVLAFLLVAGGVFAIGKVASSPVEKVTPKIVTTNFIGYDLARAVAKDELSIEMLLKPGAEAHEFEPTPEDIVKITDADLFIYNGGESEAWVEKLLADHEVLREKTLKLTNLVSLKTEEIADGMEAEEAEEGAEEAEYDEHIWTSVLNARILLTGIKDQLVAFFLDLAETFKENYAEYDAKLEELDQDFHDIVDSSEKKTLVFGDRFPFRYFVDEYGLNYYAAFPGCSEQTEASSNTIAFLIEKIKEAGINVVLKIELSSDKLAKTIADETGAQIMELNASHNISQEDFDNGVTYVDIMNKNKEVLIEALK